MIRSLPNEKELVGAGTPDKPISGVWAQHNTGSKSGSANGLIPMLRVFNATARLCDQGGGKRPGGCASCMEGDVSLNLFPQGAWIRRLCGWDTTLGPGPLVLRGCSRACPTCVSSCSLRS